MDRCYLSGAVETPPDIPRTQSGRYPTAGSNITGVPATVPGPAWFYSITEEIRNAIVSSGQTPDPQNLTQLWHAIMLASHPVGSIYQSSDPTDPGTLFGGTWVPIKGRMLIGASEEYGALSEGGEASHVMTVDEMPSHSHRASESGAQEISGTTGESGGTAAMTSWDGAHSHTRGSMNITGSAKVAVDSNGERSNSGALYYGSDYDPNFRHMNEGYNSWGNELVLDASRSWTGSTSTDGRHAHSVTLPAHAHELTASIAAHSHEIGKTGGGRAFDTISPYLAVYMWRRTA